MANDDDSGDMEKIRKFVNSQFNVPRIDDPNFIARFEELLQFYAKSLKIERKNNIMKCVEIALVALMGKDVKQPDKILVALAGVQGSISYADLTGRELLCDLPEKNYSRLMEFKKADAIRHSAKWLSGNNRITFLKNKKLLAQLLDEHFKDEDSLH